jgi:hypothetical protein
VNMEGGRGKGEGGREAAASGSAAPAAGLSILFVGDAERAEFCEAGACLERQGTLHRFSDADSAAVAMTEDRVLPDVIVVAQAFPGEFSHRAIDRLRRLAPLARVVGLMGSWCEGEMRSGSPWPATMRTYWHQWPARCGRQFRRLAMGQSCSWALPLTATEEERLLADAAEMGDTVRVGATVALRSPSVSGLVQQNRSSSECPHPNPLPRGEGTGRFGGLVVIHSRSSVMADWLSAACRGRGFVALSQRELAFARVEGAAAGVFDAGDLSDDESGTLRRFVAALRPAPVVALLSFPRIEDHRRALSAGATAALSKPLMVDDLLVAIEARDV